MDGLGEAGSHYRTQIYTKQFSGRKSKLAKIKLEEFISITLKYLEHTIDANKRSDNLQHAYNLMTVVNDSEIAICYLDEMLEGQVAALSSGYLRSEETLKLLDALKASKLFREDQYSYLLYPNKQLPRFMQKNNIPEASVEKSQLIQKLIANGNRQVVSKDVNGHYHFNGNFNNANSLIEALNNLNQEQYGSLIEKDKTYLLKTFEDIFNHKAFTGRSGTFYGYEGLGSIYWHMVSKLQLAVQECCLKAISENAGDEVIGRLLEHYYEINEGIGVHKSPKLYGAFPTDPYSHTPAGKGAQQPGMTGQVKEDILSRIGELGVFVTEGRLYFNPCLLRKDEFLKTPKNYHYINLNKEERIINLEPQTLAFTYCQIPVIYKISETEGIEILNADGSMSKHEGLNLNRTTSQSVFSRTGLIEKITVYITSNKLK